MLNELKVAAVLVALALCGCETDEPIELVDGSVAEDASAAFESDDPRTDDLYGPDDDYEECEGNDEPFEYLRALREAKRVAVEEARIVALSPHGLTVSDATDPDEARVVGRDLSIAVPIEVELLDSGVALVISDASTGGGCAAESYGVQLTTLDVNDPAHIEPLGREVLAGAYTGLRRIGHIAYVTTWHSYSTVQVTAFDLADPRALVRIATRSFTTDSDVSVTPQLFVTGERLYAGVQQADGHIEVQVVPLGGERGTLGVAATFEVQGWLDQLWPIDEHEGTLRIFTRPERDAELSALEMFAVSDDHQVSRLGGIELEAPAREAVFDGDRAYVSVEEFAPATESWSVQWQPIDLRDPAAPRLEALLDIADPHSTLLPFDDRLVAVSWADDSAQSSNVTLFDVSDLATPVQLDHAVVPGRLGAIEATSNLLAIQTWRDDEGSDSFCAPAAVKLVDIAADSLVVRGTVAVPADLQQLRLLDDRLLAMTRYGAELFAIGDRDAPVALGDVAFARHVELSARIDGRLVLVSSRDQHASLLLDVYDLDSKASSLPIGSASWASPDCNPVSYLRQLVVDGTRVHVLYEAIAAYGVNRVATFDVSDPHNPRLESDEVLGTEHAEDTDEPSTWHYGSLATKKVGQDFVQLEELNGFFETPSELPAAKLEVMHTEPSGPPSYGELALGESVEPPTLATHGDTIYVGRMETLEDSKRVQFVVDRIDLDDPAAPAVAGTYDVPGRLLHVLDDDRLLTVSYRRVESPEADEWACFDRDGLVLDDGTFDREVVCVTFEETLHLVRLEGRAFVLEDSFALETGAHVVGSAEGDERIFVMASREYNDSQALGRVVVLSALDHGRLDAEEVAFNGSGGRGVALGHRFVYLNSYGAGILIDATDADAVTTQPLTDVCPVSAYMCEPSESGFAAMGYAGFAAIE